MNPPRVADAGVPVSLGSLLSEFRLKDERRYHWTDDAVT